MSSQFHEYVHDAKGGAMTSFRWSIRVYAPKRTRHFSLSDALVSLEALQRDVVLALDAAGVAHEEPDYAHSADKSGIISLALEVRAMLDLARMNGVAYEEALGGHPLGTYAVDIAEATRLGYVSRRIDARCVSVTVI